MERARLFIKELIRLALIGDSWMEKFTKWAGLLLTTVGVSYTTLWHPGFLVYIAIPLSFYAGFISNIAWLKSEKPVLSVGETLEKDSAYLTWRLRIVNEWNTPVAVCVAMKSLYCDREDLIIEPTLFPIKLEWSHHDKVDTLKLARKEEGTVTVFGLELEQTSLQLYLRVWGAKYRGYRINLQNVQKVWCDLEIYCPEYDTSICRTFMLEKIENENTNFKVSTIAMNQLKK